MKYFINQLLYHLTRSSHCQLQVYSVMMVRKWRQNLMFILHRELTCNISIARRMFSWAV